MTASASQSTNENTTSKWVTECPNSDASPFLKLALLLIVVFCAGSRLLGSPASTESMVAVGGLGLLYAIGVVALTIRTYRQS